jgi:pilus assembly protein FimV
VLLGGYGAWAWRRKKKAAESRFADSVLGGASSLGSTSVFSEPGAAPSEAGTAGGQGAAARSAAAGAEGDNVDPIAEADVYMAYGRDAQAEEILKEALAKNPGRVALQLKLLEVYAARKDNRSFEQVVMKLKEGTGGRGPDWNKAMTLGHGLDPQNPMYGGVASASIGSGDTQRIAAVAAPSVDFDIGGGSAAEAGAALDMALDTGTSPAAGPAAASVDFDLGGGQPSAPAEKTDFAPTGTLIMDSKEAVAASSGLDFDLGGDEAAPAPVAAGASAPVESSGGLDFDLNLDLGDETAPAPAAEVAPDIDLASISLDLGSPGGGGAAPDAKWQEIATKLDLAKAYEEMGDKDGARALLREVVNDGDAAQQKQAEQMLSGLG